MLNILVVDDDIDLLEMVTIFLENAEMRVQALSKIAGLTKIIRSFKPDLILMDIYLGGDDGRIVCHELKTSEYFGHIPVILYSAGNISSVSIHESLTDAFISKPFDIDAMIATIKSLTN